MLPTKAFLAPMAEDEEIEVELSKGNTVVIKFKALSELQPNGKRCVCVAQRDTMLPAGAFSLMSL